jgi:hypothetical protein
VRLLTLRGLPHVHRRPGVDDEAQWPDSDEIPGVITGTITRNRLQEAEGFERDTSENLWEHPETTDPWGVTDG